MPTKIPFSEWKEVNTALVSSSSRSAGAATIADRPGLVSASEAVRDFVFDVFVAAEDPEEIKSAEVDQLQAKIDGLEREARQADLFLAEAFKLAEEFKICLDKAETNAQNWMCRLHYGIGLTNEITRALSSLAK